MDFLNFMSFVVLSVIYVFAVQIHTVPVESNNWLVDATNAIKESTSAVESYRVQKNNEKMQVIADESFNSFSSFAEEDLSEMIDKIDGMKSEEAFVLESKVSKWLKDLKTLKYYESDVIEKKNEKLLRKFLVAMDYISKEVVGFYNNYNFESSESAQLVEKLKSLTKGAVTKLAECAKSVENQVSGIIDDNSEIIDDSTDY